MHKPPYQPLKTAPRDGAVIELAALYDNGTVEASADMRWQGDAKNGMFPGVVGFWVTPDHPGPNSMTWNEADLAGAPTHWRHVGGEVAR